MSQTQEVRGVATTIRHDSGKTIVRYHATDVVSFSDTEIVLDSGGWQTATTKTRMNQAANQFALGFGVFQKNHCWFVEFQGKTLEFSDGMILKR